MYSYSIQPYVAKGWSWRATLTILKAIGYLRLTHLYFIISTVTETESEQFVMCTLPTEEQNENDEKTLTFKKYSNCW